MKLLIRTTPLAFLITFVCLILPVTAQAHGEAGMTFSATSTSEGGRQYVVDVDYSDIAIEAGRTGRFDFNLFTDAERTIPTDFTDMWIRIQKDEGTRDDGSPFGKTVFAGAVARQDFGGNGFSFLFLEGGKYTLSVRYNDTSKDRFGETVAEAEFPLEVLRSEEENTLKFTSTEFWVGLIAGLFIASLGLMPLLMRKRKG